MNSAEETVAIDRAIAFLRVEEKRLLELAVAWAVDRAAKFHEVGELLRTLRQQKQMARMDGGRI